MSNKYEFVHAVLEMYLAIPETPMAFSTHDSYIANVWFDQGVSLLQVQQAMTLAQLRRGSRRSTDPPLNQIRSLHYFVPIIQEISRQPMEEGYFRYLQRKLDDLRNPDLNRARPESSSSE